MSQGTAPRRVSPGVWVTRSGHTLTSAGADYWEMQYQAGHTDGQGRFFPVASPAGPRLEAVTRPPHPDSPQELARRRAEIISSQAMKMVAPQIADSRAAAPGPAVSGYHFLSTALGRNIAGMIPGTLTASGERPRWTGGGAFMDAMSLGPWGKLHRVNGAVLRALLARRSPREIAAVANPSLQGLAIRAIKARKPPREAVRYINKRVKVLGPGTVVPVRAGARKLYDEDAKEGAAPKLGSAPRRVYADVWLTRNGKRLTPDQAAVWEAYYQAGRTDGMGHFSGRVS